MGIRILVVEDDPVLALVAGEALTQAGHVVVGPAYDPASAYALAAAEALDLAVVDINLAGADEGLEVARTLRDRHGVPSLFVSGQLAAARAHPELAIGLLRKPYEIEDLLQSVDYAQAVAGKGASTVPVRPAALDVFSD